MAHRNLALIVVLLICLTFSACGGQSTPHPPATETKVVPTWTDMPPPTNTPKPTARPSISLKVMQPANLRAGPGTDYPKVGGKKVGDCVVSDGMNTDKTWYHLVSNAWVFAELVISVPSCPSSPTNTPDCPSGCTTPPPGCVIKGNVSFDTSEKIYHVPGCEHYDITKINSDYGERWFCTEAEAVANGWRKAYNCP